MEETKYLYATQLPKDELYKLIDGIRDHVYETPRVKNNLNAQFFPVSGEFNEEPSQTVPDQSMTIQEILRRYGAGLPMEGEKIPLYDENIDHTTDPGEYDFIDPKRYDIAELQQLEDYLIETITQRKKQAYDQKQQADAEAAAKKESNSTKNGGAAMEIPPNESPVPDK